MYLIHVIKYSSSRIELYYVKLAISYINSVKNRAIIESTYRILDIPLETNNLPFLVEN